MTNVAKMTDETQGSQLPADPMVSVIERIAMTPDLPIERLERMLDMKERMDKQAAQAQHAAAFAMASARFPAIPLNGVGHNNKRYATLKDIIAKTRPILSENGLALNFAVDTGETIRVTARLSHVSGHVETVSIDLPRDSSGSKNAVQAVGSSQTYGQRYTAQAILGLSLGEDTEDDGAASTPGTVTADQFIALRDKAAEAGIDPDKICKAHGVTDLQVFPAKDFDAAMKRLDRDIAEKGGA